MNKKDCEQIGYLLSISYSMEELREGLFKMDQRIKPQWESFEEIQGRSEEVDKLADELMCERNPCSIHWSLLKKEHLKCTYKTALEDARKQIYGDDYHPNMFKI